MEYVKKGLRKPPYKVYGYFGENIVYKGCNVLWVEITEINI